MKPTLTAIVGLLIFGALAATVYQNQRRFHVPLLTTTYQAVKLTDGTVVYGRIDHLGTDYPVLRGVIVVRKIEDPASGQTRYEAVPGKSDAHGADHMIFPAASILYVEPVAPDSPVGQVIAKAASR